jgi:hypothetical protein
MIKDKAKLLERRDNLQKVLGKVEEELLRHPLTYDEWSKSSYASKVHY